MLLKPPCIYPRAYPPSQPGIFQNYTPPQLAIKQLMPDTGEGFENLVPMSKLIFFLTGQSSCQLYIYLIPCLQMHSQFLAHSKWWKKEESREEGEKKRRKRTDWRINNGDLHSYSHTDWCAYTIIVFFQKKRSRKESYFGSKMNMLS